MAVHVIDEANRCLQCKKPMCQQGCPIHTPIPAIIKAMREGRLEEAGKIAFENNPMSLVCSLVCNHERQCEGHCVLGRKGQPIHVSSIENYISDTCFERIDVHCAPKNGKKVAVIGAGPAGITIAILLTKKGYSVTIFDSRDKIGGVLQYGIPEFPNICEEAVQSQWGEQSPGYVIRADYFNHGYETLRNINLLKSIIPTLDIRDSEKKELEGEAAFMTAYVYFYLAEKFGGVPLIKELQEYDPANPGALVVPRSTEYDTWDYVMQQCDLAAAQLPKERSDRRATRWAALALKSRAALYAASIAKFGELAPMEGEAVTKGLAGMSRFVAYFYQHCIDASLTIMTESNHKLYKPNPASPKEAAIRN